MVPTANEVLYECCCYLRHNQERGDHCCRWVANRTPRVGQNHIHTVCTRHFWQGNHHMYGHIRCIYTVLADPTHTLSANFEPRTHKNRKNTRTHAHTHTHTHTHTLTHTDTHTHTHTQERWKQALGAEPADIKLMLS